MLKEGISEKTEQDEINKSVCFLKIYNYVIQMLPTASSNFSYLYLRLEFWILNEHGFSVGLLEFFFLADELIICKMYILHEDFLVSSR